MSHVSSTWLRDRHLLFEPINEKSKEFDVLAGIYFHKRWIKNTLVCVSSVRDVVSVRNCVDLLSSALSN